MSICSSWQVEWESLKGPFRRDMESNAAEINSTARSELVPADDILKEAV